MGEPRGQTTPTLVSIQALRAVAALMVLVFHLCQELTKLGADLPATTFIIGTAGVDLFFVISGFVMVYSSERLFGQPRASIQFLARRVVRIVPLYWIATTAMVLLLAPFASTKAALPHLCFGHTPLAARQF